MKKGSSAPWITWESLFPAGRKPPNPPSTASTPREAIARFGVNSNLSLKLTQLGTDIDYQFCLDNMRKITDTAQKHNNFVRIDMEDYAHCQITLDLLRELRKEYDQVGTVIGLICTVPCRM